MSLRVATLDELQSDGPISYRIESERTDACPAERQAVPIEVEEVEIDAWDLNPTAAERHLLAVGWRRLPNTGSRVMFEYIHNESSAQRQELNEDLLDGDSDS